ncbi:MAG TPA: hypothetical protein VI197_16910 [Polyangiaceae bacterium]
MDETTAGATFEVTRNVALWTHGVTAAAFIVGATVYSIRGLRTSEIADYEADCDAGVPGACSRYEATERERRLDRELGGALLLSSLAPVAGLLLFDSSNPARLDPSNRGAASVLSGATAALSIATAGLFVHTFKLRSDFGDAADACFGGDCDEMMEAEFDVSSSLALPMIVTGINYVLSMSGTVWLSVVQRHEVSLAPALDTNYTGATLTGRF